MTKPAAHRWRQPPMEGKGKWGKSFGTFVYSLPLLHDLAFISGGGRRAG